MAVLVHYASLLIGVAFILIGLLTIWTPVPIGAVCIATGSVVLAQRSDRFRRAVRAARRRWPRLDYSFRWLQARTPHGLAQVIAATDPTTVHEAE